MSASASARSCCTDRVASLSACARSPAAATAERAAAASCGAAAYLCSASASLPTNAAGEPSSSGSLTVPSRRFSASRTARRAPASAVAPNSLSKRAALLTRVMEASLTPPPGSVTRLAILRVAPRSPARATLRDTTRSGPTLSPARRVPHRDRSRASCGCPNAGDAAVPSALWVDQHVHQLGAGLEHLGVGGIAALRLDHGRQLGGEIDRRLLERARHHRAVAAAAGKTDVDVAGRHADPIDVARQRLEIVGARHVGQRYAINRHPRSVLEYGGQEPVVADLDALHAARSVAVHHCIEHRVVGGELAGLRHVQGEG